MVTLLKAGFVLIWNWHEMYMSSSNESGLYLSCLKCNQNNSSKGLLLNTDWQLFKDWITIELGGIYSNKVWQNIIAHKYYLQYL